MFYVNKLENCSIVNSTWETGIASCEIVNVLTLLRVLI